MDFQSMMETFAEAWVAANTQTPLTEAAAAAAAADHQNLLLGLGGSAPGGPTLDIASSEQMARRLGTSPSATQSPGLNLSSQHTDPDPESLSPAFVASSLLEMKDVISGNNGRNIPLHCIIERANPSLVSPGASSSSPSGSSQPSSSQAATPPATSNTPGDLSLTPGGSSSTPTSGPGSSQAGGPGNSNNSGNLVVEADTYAILPSNIPFADIVRASLTKLGYAPQEMVGAKGLVQLRNWKPLSLDQISESVEATIGDILGDISSFITLRIRLFRPRMSAAHELKDKLLQVLIAHSYSLLTNSGSSIDQILSSLIRGGRNDQIELNNDDARRRFDQWYLQQVFNQYRQLALAAQQPPVPVPALRPNGGSSAGAPPTHPLFMDLNLNGSEPSLAGLHPSLAAAAAAAAVSVRPTTNGNLGSGNGSNSSEKMYGGHKQNSSGNGHGCHQNTSASSHHSSSMTSSRTRIRTSFDPELELPKLHKWFQENRHPSRSQVQEYVKELNSLESRKGRKPLDVNNVVYWFKNARAAHKRAELKFISGDSSSNMGNHQFGGFGQNSSLGPSGSGDYFINGGNHSPGKASSEASKCNDEPMSNASRNGSNLDDYYSFDEDGDSHEETQTLDLSVRPHGHNCPRKSHGLSESPIIKLEEPDELDDLKPGQDSEFRSEICSGQDHETGSNADSGKMDLMEHSGRNTDCGASSDCNSIEEDSEEETETSGSLGTGPQYNNVAAASGLARNLSNLMAMGNGSGTNNSTHNPESPEGRRARRSRTFIDPMSEVPRLESWFMSNTHPAHSQIVRYTDELNKMPYRQKFPKLEPKNIQFWFKNRRAKIKRTSGLNPSALMAAAAVTGAPTSSGAGTLPSTSIHNSSALNIERLINAH